MLRINNNMAGFVLVILCTALAGCTDESSATLRAKALAYQQKGEYNAAAITLKNALEATPDDGATRYQLATVYIDNGDVLSAEKEIRLALKLAYNNDLVMPALGKALLMLGQYDKVIEETEQAAARNKPDLLCVRADAYQAMGKSDDARQLYNRVLKADPKFAPALIGMGRQSYLERDVAAARKYADEVLAAEPRNTDALMFKGDLLRAQKQPDQALAIYEQVLKINPGHRTAHVEKAFVAISIGKFDAAQADLDIALEAAPGSVLVAYTQALLEFSQGKNAAAQEAVQNVLHVASEHMPSVLLAAAISLNLGSLHQAEDHLRHYLRKNPDNMYARKMLASTLLQSRQAPDALGVLAPALRSAPQDVQLLALAGESYMQSRDFNAATNYFEKAATLEPETAHLRTSLALTKLAKGEQEQAVSDLQLATKLDVNSERAGIALVRTELGLGHFDSAYTAVLALEKAQPKNGAVQNLKGTVLLAKHDLAQARASFGKALALLPSYFPAAVNLAQMEMADKNPAGARRHLLDFFEKNKTSVEAMSALASQDASEGKMDSATKWLEQASAVNPSAIAPAVNVIAQYLLTEQNQKALSLASKLQVTHPDNPDLLDLLGKSQLANGQQAPALETYKKLALALPRSASAQMQVAALQLVMKNTAAAEDNLKAALAIQPDFPAAQLALAEIYVRNGSNELAKMVAGRLQRHYPKAAAGYQLEGDVLMGQNKPVQALALYEQASGFSKTNELLIKTANALRAVGRQDDAAKRLAQWMQLHHDDVRVQLYKAETHLADKQYKLAAEQLEAVLKRQPKNIVGLNNLALAYQLAQDARAQQPAEEAYKLAGDQPVIMDTLGWILVEKGDAARGVAILQKASGLAPQARDIRYHLAVGLNKAGDKAAARKELELLMSGNMKFAQADQARALLKQLP